MGILKVTLLREFMEMVLPAPEPLIPGVIDRASKLAIGGGSKSYKSWILADMALSLATGTPWLNFKAVPSPQRVLYMNFEIPAYHFRQRIQAVATAKHIPLPLDMLGIMNLRGEGIGYEEAEIAMIDTAKSFSPAMTITDPLYKLLGKTDENSANEMAQLFNSLERVATQANTAISYAGHFSKGNQSGKEAIDRISGSGVHGRDPDAIINFTAHKEPGAYTVDVVLRYYEPVPSFVVRWEYPLMRVDPTLDPRHLKRAKPEGTPGRPKKADWLDVFDLLRDSGHFDSTDDYAAKAKTDLDIGRRTFDGLVSTVRLQPGVHTKNGAWDYGS